MLVYLPAMQGDFIWDDDKMLLDNRAMRSDGGLVDIWFTTRSVDYFPLTYTLLWVQWRLWGDNATGYHVINVMLHALASLVMWRVLRRLKVRGAWFAAAIFAVHPVTAASVAWISETKNTLSLLWFALSMLCYLRFDEDPARRRWYVASVLAFLAALLAKTSVVMMPVVLLGATWWRHRRIDRRDVMRTLPYWALSLVLGLVTVWFQHQPALGGTTLLRPEGAASRVAAAAWCVWFYLYKALVPIRLSMIYPRWDVDPAQWVAWLPLAFLATAGGLTWRHRRPLALALGYYVLVLLPVLGLVAMSFHQHSLVSDHLQYIALIAPAAAVAALLNRLPMGTAAGVVVLAILSLLTWHHAGHFQNQQTLWSHTLRLNPDAVAAHNNLGLSWAKRDRHTEALVHYREALRRRADFAPTYSNMALSLEALGQPDQAMEALRTCLELYPRAWRAHYNLANMLRNAGRPDQAVIRYRLALKHHPDYVEAHINLANVLYAQGRFDQAWAHYQAALRWEPDAADVHFNLANAYRLVGRYDLAIRHYRLALQTAPEHVDAHMNLAIALIGDGQMHRAMAHVRQAIELQPQRANAHALMGDLMGRQGRVDEAIQSLRTARRLGPDEPIILSDLARLLVGQSRTTAEALALAQRAAELTDRRHAHVMDTLALAYAAAGDFAAADRAAASAAALADEAGQTTFAQDIRRRQQRYHEKVRRETPNPASNRAGDQSSP